MENDPLREYYDAMQPSEDCIRRLRELEASLAFILGIHGIIASENTGNINAFRTRHAIPAPGAADLFEFADLSDHFLQGRKIIRGKRTGLRFGSYTAVFLNHFHGIHAGKHHRHFFLVIKPSESPFCRGPVSPAPAESGQCALRKHIYELSAS